MTQQTVIDKMKQEVDDQAKKLANAIYLGSPTIDVHRSLLSDMIDRLNYEERQLQHEDKMRELLTGFSTNVIDQGIAGIQPLPQLSKEMKYFASIMSNNSGTVTMNPIKPRTNIGRIITKTHLVYDLIKKKKYIAQVSDRLTTFEEVDTDRPATHTSYDGSEKLIKVKGIEIDQLLYYIGKGVYSEIELRKMVLKEIKGKKKMFMESGEKTVKRVDYIVPSMNFEGFRHETVIQPPDPDKIDTFKSICRRFDRCEKLVRLASVKDYSNLNEARVAYKMLMKEYTIIITALMCEGGE